MTRIELVKIQAAAHDIASAAIVEYWRLPGSPIDGDVSPEDYHVKALIDQFEKMASLIGYRVEKIDTGSRREALASITASESGVMAAAAE